MPLRIAVLTRLPIDPLAIQAGLGGLMQLVTIRRIPRQARLLAPFELIRFRPDLIIAEAADFEATLAVLYRMVQPNTRLLVHAPDMQRVGWLSRLIRRHADATVANDSQLSGALERLRFDTRFQAAPMPDDLELFASCPRYRNGDNAHRIIYAGDLSPASGAADVFLGLCAWAEQHPGRELDICWLGEGDLVGVLETQPLPSNLRQQFITALDRQELAACFARCGILITPPLANQSVPLAAEALTAGVIVLAARRSGIARPGALELSFDPTRPDEVMTALTDILGRSVPELDAARDQGRVMLQRSSPRQRAARTHGTAAVSA